MKFLSLSGSYIKASGGSSESPEMASTGLHTYIYKIISKLRTTPFSALDLGAGSGAWGKRLIAQGHKAKGIVLPSDMASCDLEVVCGDLSVPFADRLDETFDVITCIEVLEHVENPWNVFREARKLLRPGGIFLISTPNASGMYSRLKFLVVGRFAMFDDFHYNDIGHITPITYWQLEKMFAENGFEICVLEDYDATPKRIRTLGDILKRGAWLLRPMMRGHVGTQHIIVAGRLRAE